MNCPYCNSNQTNVDMIRRDFAFVECVNCDKEGYTIVLPDDSPDLAFAEYRARSRRRRR